MKLQERQKIIESIAIKKSRKKIAEMITFKKNGLE